MPIYAYRCASCGHAKDVLQKLSDPPLTVCPSCGASAFAKQVTAAGFQLKGSGWYATDFKGGNGAKKPDPVEGEGNKADASKTDAGKVEAGKSETGKSETGKTGESSAPAKSGESGTSSKSSDSSSTATTGASTPTSGSGTPKAAGSGH